jgi:hypothetical protein
MSFIFILILAQTAGGSVLGKVADATGAILPGVVITIKNTATGINRGNLRNYSGVSIIRDGPSSGRQSECR